jgi:hypothetical protein
MLKLRSTIILLAVVTAALCMGALAWVVAPVAGAESASQPQDGLLPQVQASERIPGPAPLPLRWHVDHAVNMEGYVNTYCATSIVVLNVTSAPVLTQVEWFDNTTGSVGYLEATVPAGRMRVFMTDVDVYPVIVGGIGLGMDFFVGNANVHAKDPRIHVSAYITCRDGTGIGSANVVALTSVGTAPVGATAEFFQAGMPASWTPPMAEVPE